MLKYLGTILLLKILIFNMRFLLIAFFANIPFTSFMVGVLSRLEYNKMYWCPHDNYFEDIAWLLGYLLENIAWLLRQTPSARLKHCILHDVKGLLPHFLLYWPVSSCKLYKQVSHSWALTYRRLLTLIYLASRVGFQRFCKERKLKTLQSVHVNEQRAYHFVKRSQWLPPPTLRMGTNGESCSHVFQIFLQRREILRKCRMASWHVFSFHGWWIEQRTIGRCSR
jgi:hypothetical protein